MGAMTDMAEEKPKSSLEQAIDENLKRAYQEALQQEVPDRFKELLAALKAKEGRK
ncbi:MAG: NepR family anti-sigma factor [Gemmobacter sp.]